MKDIRDLVDRSAQRFCGWLADFFPGHHGIALAGAAIAGMPNLAPMPVDRRLGLDIRMSNRDEDRTRRENGKYVVGGSPGGAVLPQDNCGFWAYCHMSGYPCVRCGGRNYLPPGDPWGSHRCPSGKILGQFWSGCCRDESGNERLIAFIDCCGKGFCTGQRCRNWHGAKNWCFFPRTGTDWFGPRSYFCTIVAQLQDNCGD